MEWTFLYLYLCMHIPNNGLHEFTMDSLYICNGLPMMDTMDSSRWTVNNVPYK